MSEYTPIEILLIEDDPGDVLLTREAFDDHKLRNRLVVFGDGREALCHLKRQAPYTGATPPDLIPRSPSATSRAAARCGSPTTSPSPSTSSG
jgi:hypothetical protein